MTTATPARRRTKTTTEHPRCENCGWTLYESLRGELRCPHPTCPRHGETVHVLPRDLGILAEVQE